MVRVAKKVRRHVARSRLSSNSLPKKRLAIIIAVGLVVVGAVVTLSSFASSGRVDVLMSVSDESGGFHNGLVAINPANGNKIGSVALPNMASLSGCAPTQPKPYIYDTYTNIARQTVIAGMKPCRGGRLNSAQVIAKFDLVGMRFDSFVEGPSEGVASVQSVDNNSYAVLNATGNGVWIYNYDGGVRHRVSLGGEATRFGTAFGNIIVGYANGGIDRIDVGSGKRERLANIGVSLPKQVGVDGLRLIPVGNTVFTLSQASGQSSLVAVTNQGQVRSYNIGSVATSLDITPNGEVLMIATGCPTSTNCVEKPNRLYAFVVATRQFQRSTQFEYLPLQTSPSRIRFDSAGETVYFDGVVSGSNGVGQRFVFSLELNSTQLLSARVAVPSSAWSPIGIDANSLNFDSQTPVVDVLDDIPNGGGVGTGEIGTAPVPLDEIERLLGMSIWEIDWSQITDEQILAFGYDPAQVRRYIAQMRLQAGSSATIGSTDTITCRMGSAEGSEQIAAIERVLGVSLLQFDFDKVTDEQIRAFGYDPAQVREVVARYKQNANSKMQDDGDPCANTYTQDAFVVDQNSDTPAVANGTVTHLSAQTKLDIFSGGWIIDLRWQAPGGATKFYIYGRDNKSHKLEKRLAVVGGLTRVVKFGGFGRISLPVWHASEYTLAVVPEQADGTMGVPTAVKANVNCYILYCKTTAVNR